jgi:hypothetical protein
LRLPLPDCFSTTATEPIEGTKVDSFPVDHLTRKSDPVTPVTTPSRGDSPTFVEETRTRSPTTAMHRMVPRRGVSGQRGPTSLARRRSWRLFNVPRLRGGTLNPRWLRPVTARTRISVAGVKATGAFEVSRKLSPSGEVHAARGGRGASRGAGRSDAADRVRSMTERSPMWLSTQGLSPFRRAFTGEEANRR